MNYIKREKESEIRELLKTKEIIAVMGPRQAGKTTLIKHVLAEVPDSISYSFDIPNLSIEFTQDPKSFYERYMKNYKVVFLDEIQYIKDSGKILKYLYDTFPETKIIISGSSAPEIAIQSLQYLVGRVFLVNVLPLSLGEFIQYKDKDLYQIVKTDSIHNFVNDLRKITSEYMIYGGYPRVVIESSYTVKEKILEDLSGTLLLKEVRDIIDLADTEKTFKLVKTLSLMTGSLVEYKKLSENSGLVYETIKKYLKLLESIYVIQIIKPFFVNKLKEISKAEKIYYIDPGIRNSLIKDFRTLDLRNDVGELFELLVARLLQNKELKYWRNKSKNEIDFISFDTGNTLHPYEVKYKQEYVKQSTSDNFAEIHGKHCIDVVTMYKKSDNEKGVVYPWELL